MHVIIFNMFYISKTTHWYRMLKINENLEILRTGEEENASVNCHLLQMHIT